MIQTKQDSVAVSVNNNNNYKIIIFVSTNIIEESVTIDTLTMIYDTGYNIRVYDEN